ncbi:MAG: hypothetical protein MI861_19920 [Pirellulales bacterium]|nr:hypothetical protein [Pirellulales bacterium]
MSLCPFRTDTSVSRSPEAVAVALPRENRRSLRLLVALFLIAGLMAVMASVASGQQQAVKKKYAVAKLDPAFSNEKTIKEIELAAKSFASGVQGVDERYAKAYFATYVPGKITDPAALPQMSDMLKNMTTLLNRSQRSNKPAVAAKVLGWVFSGMSQVAEGNYHPPARINALLVLSRLDETLANQVTRTPPIPKRETLPILIRQYQNEANVDGVRAAALQGLHRYVSYGLVNLSANDRNTIQTEMANLLASEPPPGRSVVAHAYLQRFAVDMLDLLRPQQDSGLGVQLISISTESDKHDLIALHSTARLGAMSQELQGKVAAPGDVLKSWSGRALKAFEGELARLKALERPKKAQQQPRPPEDYLEKKNAANRVANNNSEDEDSMQMMMLMEQNTDGGAEMADESEINDMQMMMLMGMDDGKTPLGAPANPQPPEVIAARRKLNHVLQLIHLGVTGSPAAGMPRNPGGLLAMVSEEQKPEVEAWITTMEEIVTGLNEETLDDRRKFVQDGLEVQIKALENLAGVEEAAEKAMMDDLNELLNADPSAPAKAANPANSQTNAQATLEQELGL